MMYQIYFYVPQSHLQAVLDALFAAGAGKIGNYDHCCWTTKGRGQFRPLSGSQPYHGEENKVEYTDELKVELVCPPENLQEVIAALHKAHPYETPAYGTFKINAMPFQT